MSSRSRRIEKPHDRITDELPGTVPRDLPAAIDVDHRCPVGGTLVRLRPLASRIDRVVFEQDERVGAGTCDDLAVDAALHLPGVEIGNCRGRQARHHHIEHASLRSFWTASNNTLNPGNADVYPSSMSGGRPHAVSRDSIAEAACELFLEQGYERTTVAHIARRVGVSRSSFFNYFESKSEVFWSGLDERIEFLDGFLAAACPSSRPAEVVADAVREAFSRFTPDALALALVNSEAMGVVPELTQEMATRQWRIAASISPYLRRTGEEALAAEVHAAAYAGAVVAALRAWALAGAGRESLDDLLRRALGVLR